MVDLLIAWGVAQAVGFIFKPILEDLAKDAAKDFAKDFLKDSLKHVLLPDKEPLNIAIGKAIKEFLQLVQQQLEVADLSEAEQRQYTEPLKQFLKNKSVKEILGSAFKDDCQGLDTKKLAKIWNDLNLLPLPDEFNWKQVNKPYLNKVKAIIRELPQLRAILDSQKLEGIEQNTKELAGIVPGFELAQYQEAIRERYANLNLDSLDTSVYDYREKLKVWQVFIAQNVRECQEFLPQVYEIPKEHQKRLRESNELEAEFDPEEWERYKQVYYQQSVRSVLDVVNEMQSDRLPPQPPLVRGEQDSLLFRNRKEQGSSTVPLLNNRSFSEEGLGGVNSSRYIVILGDPGSGKSMLLQYLALNWARTPLNNVIEQPIPLLIELRAYKRDRNSGQCKDFLEFFHKGSVICRLNQHQLHEQLKAGKVLVMFDGLDEVFDPVQREDVITDIHRFTNDYPNVRVIVTSRIIGYKPQRLRDAQFRHFMLQDLESEQIQDFIHRWHELTFTDEADKVRKRERLQQAINTSKAIGELAGNPLLLTMMAILNRNQELPRDRPELYNQASRVLLHQWDVEQKLLENPRIDSVAIDYKDKQAMLRQMAYHMQAADKGLAGNLIRGEDLEKILIGYLKSIEVGEARTVARLLIEQLRSRNFILCYLGADSYGFVHRTFLEYFCACEFVERFGKRGLEGGLTLEELKTEVFGKHWQDEAWHEVLRLISGMIDERFAGEVIEYLMEQDGESSMFSNLFLASKCLSEVKNYFNIQTIADRLLNDLKNLTKYELNYYCRENINEQEPRSLRDINIQALFTSTFVRSAAVRELARGWKNDPETLPILKARLQSDSQPAVRQAVVEELVRSWKDDPDTLAILKNCIHFDDDFHVRSAAIEELVRGWKDDPDTLAILKTCALCDDNGIVRMVAIEELARGWKDDPGTLPWLKTCALSGNDWEVQMVAIEELIRGWKDDPDTLPWLKTRALSDTNKYVRHGAMRELAKGWKDESGMFEFLCGRAVNHPFERKDEEEDNLRQKALEIIIKQYPDHPQTLPLLQDRAEHDPDEKVREFAREKLEHLERQNQNCGK